MLHYRTSAVLSAWDVTNYSRVLSYLKKMADSLLYFLHGSLNSFRSYGMRFVLYNYITNEYGMSDTRAGGVLGVKRCARGMHTKVESYIIIEGKKLTHNSNQTTFCIREMKASSILDSG